jgi:hypothetical protein
MVPLASLWLPILVSAVIVFLASWIIHMFLPHHRSDFAKLPQEDAALDALRALQIPAGSYMAPHANTPAQMKQPDYLERRKRGPIVILNLSPGGDMGMGKPLSQWFVYLLVISLFAGYLACHVIAAGAPYLAVFRIVGTASFMAYALGHAHQSIWYRQAWSTTGKYVVDGLIYALLTAGVFGCFWPR